LAFPWFSTFGAISFVDNFGGRHNNLLTRPRSSGTVIRFRILTEFNGFRVAVYKLTCESEAECRAGPNFHFPAIPYTTDTLHFVSLSWLPDQGWLFCESGRLFVVANMSSGTGVRDRHSQDDRPWRETQRLSWHQTGKIFPRRNCFPVAMAVSTVAEAGSLTRRNPNSPQNPYQPHNLSNPTSVGRETC
jgi:hypothetical protein